MCMEPPYHRDAIKRNLDKQPLEFDWGRLTRET